MYSIKGKNRLAAVLLSAALFSPLANALVIDLTVDTTALNGTSGVLVWDLTNGDGSANNTAVFNSFSTDGALGASNTIGDVSGATLPTTIISDTFALNSVEQAITFGNTLSFNITVSENFAGGLVSDAFTFSMLNSGLTDGVVQTNDPFGLDAIFSVDLNAPNSVFSKYSVLPGGPQVTLSYPAVPEPGILMLFGIGLAALGIRRIR